MKKMFLALSLSLIAMMAFSQVEVPVSGNYVFDGETGELIQVVKSSDRLTEPQVVYESVPQKEVLVVERQTPVVAAVNAVTQAVVTGALIQSVVHKMKYHHHHYRHHHYRHYSHYTPPRFHHHPSKPRFHGKIGRR